MGSRDIRKKETKKQKKDGGKSPQFNISEPRPQVEVIRKARKQREEQED